MLHTLFASLLLAASVAPGPAAHVRAERSVVAVKAGTIHLVQGDVVITGGGTILIEDGKIVAVGKDADVPSGVRVVDYGPGAVIAPGLVAADSTYGAPRPAERTADPTVMAINGFDPYASYTFALAEGVTSTYLAPARGRLIAGQGAVVKLGGPSGERGSRRIVSESATIHGAISSEARNTPGYWQPPIPATVDVGMGVEQPQLPRSLMGAIVALKEILALAQSGEDGDEYGPGLGAALRTLMTARKPWRMTATTEPEIRALLAFFSENGLPLVIDGANEAAGLAEEIKKSGASVIVDAWINANQPGRDLGKGRDAAWPRFDTAAALARAGVRFAIAPSGSASDLRVAAAVASRGGLDAAAALRAITLSPAEILGVADRIGSLAPGKDADFVVFNGPPVGATSSVLATWIDGEIVFKAYETSAVVLEVDELHLGDGEVVAPGQVLMQDGVIREVGRKVGHPPGATVVRGKAAMPGMIDALGHLGLEGSTRVPATRFELGRIVEPGDFADLRVARAGVTTVVLSPRGTSRNGAPMTAYKPAGPDPEKMIVRDPVALRFQWTDRNRLESGKSVREVLAKAVEYAKKWDEYEKKLATWTPPKEAESPKAEDKKDGEKKDGEADKKESDEKKDGAADKDKDKDKDEAKKDDGKKDKAKKKGDKEPAKPVTGAWETKVTVPPFAETRLRLHLLDEEGKISGSLRCDALSDDLVQVAGERKEKAVTLSGDGSRGKIALELEEKDDKLSGKLTHGATAIDVSLSQTSTEYEVAKRPERRKPKEEKKKEVKGEPRSPGVDPDLEPLRRAMKGEGAVVVSVDREDEIVECVDAFEDAGIRPILHGANDAWKVADKIRGRVAGVLLTQRVIWVDPKTGTQKRNRYAELAAAGIPVAFHSAAEEGAVDLPLMAAYAVSQGMSPEGALRALTYDAAAMFSIEERVGAIAPGLDADIVLLDGSPLELSTAPVRVWVGGVEVR